MGSSLVTLSSTQVPNMLLILALVSSPIEWDAKDPKLRSLLESGGHADTTGSWTPDYTPEVKAALKFFIDSYNTVELGGLELLQAKQIPNAYIADTPEVAAAKEAFMAAFEAAEMGKHAEMVPVNNDIQAGQIASAYLDDTEAVVKAKAAHMTAVEEAAAAAKMSSDEMMATPMKMVAPVEMAQPVIYHQPLMHYQLPHYLPTTYNLFGR